MKNKTLYILVVFNLLITSILCFLFYADLDRDIDLSKSVIKTRGLIVVDSLGVERVIIGAPLPDPSFLGYRIPRGSNEGGISGLLLFDSEGQERGGYVTDDYYGNIFLTLDSKSKQSALFISEPDGPAALQIWAGKGNKISLVTTNDTVEFSLIRNGEIVKH